MINNRTVIYMTILVLISMGVLFVLNMTDLLTGKEDRKNYLSYNYVRGIAVKHQGLLYTLNFEQQNELIDIINQSIQIQTLPKGKREASPIDQIIIYRFQDQPDLILTPVAYINNELVYSVPDWNANGYMQDVSEGKLKKLLSQTYDH